MSCETIFGCWTYFRSAGATRETIFGCLTYKRRNVPWDNIWLLDLFSSNRRNVLWLWGTIFWQAQRQKYFWVKCFFLWKRFVATILMVEDWVLKGSLRIRENKNGKIQIFSLKAWNLITKQSKSYTLQPGTGRFMKHEHLFAL